MYILGVKAILVDRLDEYYTQLDDDQPIGEAEEEGDDIEEVGDEEEEGDVVSESPEDSNTPSEQMEEQSEEPSVEQSVEQSEEQSEEESDVNRDEELAEAARLKEQEELEAKLKQEQENRLRQEEAERLAEEQRLKEQKELEAKLKEQERLKREEAERLAEAARLKEKKELEARLKAEEQERLRQENAKRLAEAKQREEAEKKKQLEIEAERKRIEEAKRVAEAAKKAEAEKIRQEQAAAAAAASKVEAMDTTENTQKKSLFKAEIARPPPNLAGPHPSADELESSPKKGPVPLMSLQVEPPSEDKQPPTTQELRLPSAVEKALAFKGEWAANVGVSPGEIDRIEREGLPQLEQHTNKPQPLQEMKKQPQKPIQLVESMDDEDKSKGKKKNKKKKKKKNRPEEWARQELERERRKQEAEEAAKNETPDVEVEYIQEKLDLNVSDPLFRTFSRIFEAFKIQDGDEDKRKHDPKMPDYGIHNEELKKVPKMLEEDDMIEEKEEEDDDGQQKLSKRKLKKLNRLSVAELKQLVIRPDVVEMHDVTAKDPGLLVHLKSIRNTVPVPRHWCFKRKYLQGKRGIEKPPFDLPDFIKKTGIMEMREALQEKEAEKSLKSKMREKVRPKLGKIDIDYQKLHDAFFKWQTKPRMTHHGDLYYEGKEFEIRLKEKKPGDLSDDLRTALGMPVGPNAHKVPPPWLISMQRYGPPPSYPNLKIPGLNAPIPDGCSFGYHAGGWGKPPVDETGKPLYGDVFGTQDAGYSQAIPVEEVDQSLWGEMESESEEVRKVIDLAIFKGIFQSKCFVLID